MDKLFLLEIKEDEKSNYLSNKLIERVTHIIPNKNSKRNIFIQDYYNEDYLPESFVLIIKGMEAVLPKYRKAVICQIGERYFKEQITIILVLNIEIFKQTFKNTLLSSYKLKELSL